MKTEKFVTVKMALKGGKTKKDYVQACLDKGFRAVYSGKEVVEEGEVSRTKGFYLTPLSTGLNASALKDSN